jgi:hypothetical protein
MNLGYLLTKLLQLLWPCLLATEFSFLQKNKLGHASVFLSVQRFKLELLGKKAILTLYGLVLEKRSAEKYIPQNALF